MNGLAGLALLLCFQMGGEMLARALALPIPGPVVGMVLLLVALHFKPVRAPVHVAADFLLSHLSLLFVPVGVGVVTHMDLVASQGVQLMVVIVISTWVGLAVTGMVLTKFLPPKSNSRAGTDD